jgi:hypothetical protein
MNYGMIEGETNGFYHSTGAVSASKIRDFIKSKYLFYRKHIAKDVESPTTEAMSFGSSCHEFILEPEKFKETHAFLPPGFDGRTKEGKELKAAMEASGKTILAQKDLDALVMLRTAVFANPTAALLLTNGKPEISWRINAGLFDMQSRTDWFVESANSEQVAALNKSGVEIKSGQPIIVDLKTTAEIDAWFRPNYGSAIFQYGYHLQLAIYLAVINKIRKEQGKEIVRCFLFVVVEKQAPHDCAVIALDERSFGLAQTQLKYYLAEIGKCYESRKWEGYKDRGVIVSGVPAQIAEREEQAIFDAKLLNKVGSPARNEREIMNYTPTNEEIEMMKNSREAFQYWPERLQQ